MSEHNKMPRYPSSMLYTEILLFFLPPPQVQILFKAARAYGYLSESFVFRPSAKSARPRSLHSLQSTRQRERRPEQRFRRQQQSCRVAGVNLHAPVAALSHVNSQMGNERESTYPRRAGGRTHLQASRPAARPGRCARQLLKVADQGLRVC